MRYAKAVVLGGSPQEVGGAQPFKSAVAVTYVTEITGVMKNPVLSATKWVARVSNTCRSARVGGEHDGRAFLCR
jgi:hypothetical protein